MSSPHKSISVASPDGKQGIFQKIGTALAAIGLLILLAASGLDGVRGIPWLYVALAALLGAPVAIAIGIYRGRPAGINNDGVWHGGLTARGLFGWAVGVFLTGFYVLLYGSV